MLKAQSRPQTASGLQACLLLVDSLRIAKCRRKRAAHGGLLHLTDPRRRLISLQQATASVRGGPYVSENKWSIDHAGTRQEWLRKDLHLVLVEPVIPQNVGNIARTCAATGVGLHLVGPLGFEIDDRRLKRAGLDYWPYVAVRTYSSWKEFYGHFQELPEPRRLMAFSKFGTTHYAAEGRYKAGDWLLFGAETTGLPAEVHDVVPTTGGSVVKIPMRETHVRSLNLSVSVGVGVYEALRQLDGPNL